MVWLKDVSFRSAAKEKKKKRAFFCARVVPSLCASKSTSAAIASAMWTRQRQRQLDTYPPKSTTRQKKNKKKQKEKCRPRNGHADDAERLTIHQHLTRCCSCSQEDTAPKGARERPNNGVRCLGIGQPACCSRLAFHFGRTPATSRVQQSRAGRRLRHEFRQVSQVI